MNNKSHDLCRIFLLSQSPTFILSMAVDKICLVPPAPTTFKTWPKNEFVAVFSAISSENEANLRRLAEAKGGAVSNTFDNGNLKVTHVVSETRVGGDGRPFPVTMNIIEGTTTVCTGGRS